MKYRCLIIDDEPLAAQVIESYLQKLEPFEIVAVNENALDAFHVIQTKPVDLIFLDIEMPEVTGIEFIKSIKNPPKIILTTAYREYALEGYELDIVDYLLKPISFQRFLQAIHKYLRQQRNPVSVLNDLGKEDDGSDYIYVKADKKTHKVYLHSILYIESLKDYVKIHCEDKSLITRLSIRSLEENLPGNLFLRTHRSFLVAISKISAFTSEYIEIRNKQIPIGRKYKELVERILT